VGSRSNSGSGAGGFLSCGRAGGDNGGSCQRPQEAFGAFPGQGVWGRPLAWLKRPSRRFSGHRRAGSGTDGISMIEKAPNRFRQAALSDLKSRVRMAIRTDRSFLVSRGAGASPERFRAGHRTRSLSPRFPAGFFWVGRRRSFPWLPSVRTPSWRPSFGFSAIVLPAIPVVAGGGGLLGRVWEGATTPLPIECVVSEANSFVASQQSYPQVLRAPARIVVTI
jgi:hypothetical protein